MRSFSKRIGLSILSFVLIAVLWELVVWLGLFSSTLIPPPTTIFKALVAMLSEGVIQNDIRASFYRYIWGFSVGNCLGVLLGVVTGRIPVIRRLLNPVLNYLRSTPSVALVPISIVWFGIGNMGKVFIVIWGCMFPVWLNTFSGTREVEREYVWAAQTLGATGWRMYKEVYIPRSVPYIVAGSRVSVSTGWFGLVASEMGSGCYEGLGFRIFHSHEFFQIPEMFVAVLSIGLVALSCDALFVRLVRLFIPWWKGEDIE